MKDEEEGHESLARRDRGRCEKVDRTFNDNMEQDTVMMNIQWTFNGGGNPIDDGRNDDGRVRKSFEEKNEHQDQDLLNNMLAQHPDPPQKIVSDFLSPTDHLPESTKGRLSLKQDKNMKVRFHGEKREYVGDTFSRGSTCWNTTRRLLCHLEGGGALDNRGHCAAAL